MARAYADFAAHVTGGTVEPHWLEDGDRFWFTEEVKDERVSWLVDPVRNTVELFTPPPETLEEDSDTGGLASPDGRRIATVNNRQLWLSSKGGPARQLTNDGEEWFEWSLDEWPPPAAFWSPDSTRLVVRRFDLRGQPRIPIVHYDEPREAVTWHSWIGEREPPLELVLFVAESRERRTVDLPEDVEEVYLLTWHPNGRSFYFLAAGELARRVDLYEAAAESGKTRLLVTERAREGYLWDHLEQASLFTPLPEREQFVWKSLRDGWSQLYLYGLDGTEIRRLTKGQFRVERVVVADEPGGWLYFVARADPERIYDTHLYRVDFEGRRLERLTDAPGQHEEWFLGRWAFLHRISFSPSKRFFLDSHSSPQRPPRVDLRRADGTLIRTIAEADVGGLEPLRWSPPEEFTVLAADGETTLHGILYKPFDFEPSRKYPVINYVYGSMASLTTVPRTFVPNPFGQTAQALAQLGFVTFMVDARGTGGRNKKFRDAVYGDIGRLEIADQVAALEQLAASRPYLDLGRVGITGGSYGGYLAVRGMLAAPGVYSVGVARAPISTLTDHHNIGLAGQRPPVPEGYTANSNIPLADNLEGKLLIIHGTADAAVPIGQTMRLVQALIEAGKPIDLLIMPDETHGSSGIWQGYGQEALERYFCEHLLPGAN
jgi:dipeptidyl aminopeptidase/acylaminoacyl peptidase